MAKFVLVDEAPEKIHDDEYVINMPDFLPEIRGASAKKIAKNITTTSYLRSIANMIAIAYDREFDANRHISPARFEGREYLNEKDLSNIVLEMLQDGHPAIFDKYLEHQLRNRPFGTKLIYFTGPLAKTTVFYQNGLDYIEEKDVDVYMGRKPKKVVGKPALTKEEAETRNNPQ